jgi:hypothetical protein
MKPIFPNNSGMWHFKFGHFVSSGTSYPPPQSSLHEVSGMWYIPIALTLGGLALLVTTWAIRASLRVSQRWQARL